MTAIYPADAACAGTRAPLWDATVEGETAEEREARHHRAKAICRRCAVRRECYDAVDWQWDEGIRGAELLPEKRTAARPSRQRSAA